MSLVSSLYDSNNFGSNMNLAGSNSNVGHINFGSNVNISPHNNGYMNVQRKCK